MKLFYTVYRRIKKTLFSRTRYRENALPRILLMLALVLPGITGYAQRITIHERNKPLSAIFKEIRRQSGYDLIYNVRAIEKVNNVSVSMANADLSSVLDKCLSGTDLTYKIGNKSIIIKEAPDTSVPGKTTPPATLRGRVTDSKGELLIGATVKARQANRAAITDERGEFVITGAGDEDVLVVSYTGYTTTELPVKGNSFTTVVLKESSQNISEIVVVGYGTQKKVNLTGAVAQVGGKEIGQRPTANIVSSLQGLLPGLNIQSNNGDPGVTPEINVRGFNSINGGAPLVLIDGIEGDIERLNPLDVESVTVLKDAASSAIYGARGAFGVILVTTKSGREGKLQVNYTNNFGITKPTSRVDFISDPYEYGKTVDAALYGYNGTTYTGYTDEEYEKIRQVASGEIAPFMEQQSDGTYKFFHNTDWYRFLFRKWQPSYSHNLSISGGTEKIQGYLSGRVYRTQTIQNIDDARLKKYNLKANLRVKVNKWLELSYNSQLSTQDDMEFGGAKNGFGGVWSNTTWYFLFPFHPSEIDGVPFDFYGNGAQGALAEKSNYIKSHSEQYINTLSARLSPLKGLQLDFNYSSRINQIANSTRLNRYTYLSGNRVLQLTGGQNRLTEVRNRSYYNVLNAYGTYTASLHEKHHFKLLLGFNQEDYDSDNVLAEQGELLANNLANLNLGTDLLRATGSGALWGIQGYFGRFNYDYKNRYLLEVNARYDGSSRFPKVSRWGFFPSVSAGWYISREKFYEPLKNVISSLKLRTSYGKLGNQNISSNTFLQLLSTGQTTWLVNNGPVNYAGAPAPLPKVVSWENSRTIDFGVDMGFFNDRVNVSFDWYQKNVEGMYLPGEPLPSVFGAAEPKENIARLRNRGFELSLGYDNSFMVGGSALRLHATASVYNFKGVITRYPNPNGLMSTFWEGQRLGAIYGYRVDGQFQTDKEAADYQASFGNPSKDLAQVYNYILNIVQNTEWKKLRAGDIKYVDINGDGAINKGNNTLADHGDLAEIGNAMPTCPFGFNISASWKNFDLSIAGAGIAKQDWYPTGDIYWGPYLRPYLSFIRKDLVSNAWTPEQPGNIYPQIYRGYAALGTQRSLYEVNDYYLTNVGYLRIKNLTLGYTLPEKLTRRAQIQSLRIYFSGENIFTWSFGNLTKYIDPEMAGSGISYSEPGAAVDRATAQAYPIGKVFSAGINLTL